MCRRILAACLIAAIGAGWFLSVPGPAVLAAQGTPCAPNTNEEISALVSEFNDGLNQHDTAALASLLSPDVVREVPRDAHAGVDETVASIDELFTAFPDMTFTANLVLADAPLAAVHFTTTGTQAATFAGNEPTGAPVTWDGMYLIKIECGKIAQMWLEVDQLAQRGQSTSTPATPVAPADAASPESCPELTRASAQTLMDTWYHDVWGGNVDLLATLTTPDIYHHWAQGPDSSGQDAQMAHVLATLDFIPGVTSTYDQMVVDGDYIAVHWEQTLGDDSWGGLNIFRTECGKIAEVWSEINLSELPGDVGSENPGA
jgi:predicted ester cyclase